MTRKSIIIARGGIDLADPHRNNRHVTIVAYSEHSRRSAEREPGRVTIYLGDGRAQLPIARPAPAPLATPPCLLAGSEAARERAQRHNAEESLDAARRRGLPNAY